MTYSNVTSIDLAKHVFQVCKASHDGTVIYNRTCSRQKLKELLVKEKTVVVR